MASKKPRAPSPLASASPPTTFTVALTPDEGTCLKQAIDVVLRNTGAMNVHLASALIRKLDTAHDAVFPPKAPEAVHG